MESLKGYIKLIKEPPRSNLLAQLRESIQQQAETIGTTPEKRAEWIINIKPEEVSQFLINLNKQARGISEDQHSFDGEGVFAGTVEFSAPPDQQDKEPLLHYGLKGLQDRSKSMLEAGSSHEEILDQAAVSLPVLVNKLHLFADGNGRTSRLLRMIIRDGITNMDERLNSVVVNRDTNRYATTPLYPIDRAISRKFREQNKTEAFYVDHDLINDTLVDYEVDAVSQIPDLDKNFSNIVVDSYNFPGTAGVYAKEKGMDSLDETGATKISLKAMLTGLSENQEAQKEFLGLYRQVRKDRVMLWADILTGKTDLPIDSESSAKWLRAINNVRKDKGQSPLEEAAVNTALKLQTVYAETYSPPRDTPLKAK